MADTCWSYLENIGGFINKTCIPDEKFMREIEEWANISVKEAEDFRRQVTAYMGQACLLKWGKPWSASLEKAVRLYLDVPELVQVVLPKYRRVDDDWMQEW